MEKNAKVFLHTNKKGHTYLKCYLETKEGKIFSFEFSPKFLNIKQYRRLVMVVKSYEEQK